jgi:Spy/CpxP family protein refolding chaperone
MWEGTMKSIKQNLKRACLRLLCGTLALSTAGVITAQAQNLSSWSCDQLWHERNAVFYNWDYCFKGQRGKNTFGNEGCFRSSQQALNAMGAENRRLVERIRAEERRRGC